jgi:dynein light intermediate chain 2
MALEYTFARKSRGFSKDLAHIWELGSNGMAGNKIGQLFQIPINESNIHSSVAVLCVDLSQPGSVLEVLEDSVNKLQGYISFTLGDLEKRGSKRPKALSGQAIKRFGDKHPDKDIVSPIQIPLIIAATKYDLFKFNSDISTLISKLLRSVAHFKGASLIYTSTKDEVLNGRFKNLINYHLFKSGNPRVNVSDKDKALFINSGSDSFESIGGKNYSKKGIEIGKKKDLKVLLDVFRAALSKMAPTLKNPEEEDWEFKYLENKYAEPSIDSMRGAAFQKEGKVGLTTLS